MCVENTPPPSSRLTRRGILAGAAALAGTTAVLAAAAPQAGAADTRDPAAPRTGQRGGDLVIEGGTLLDPATGEVTEDAVVVIVGGDPLSDVTVLKKPVRVVRSGIAL
ncbi:hypothetical protein AB0H77_17345 [Streptomyces sp. NPDC050844]|uniref:hypothetical protein n=1 Tax=Streptomyces sp. NPDC050844 TaxID=3155790 RepID=UPI0033E4AFFE